MVIFIVGSKFCTQIFQMGMGFSLLDMLWFYWVLRNALKRKKELTSLSGSLLSLNEELDYSKGVPEFSSP